jgi:hypothetical protein
MKEVGIALKMNPFAAAVESCRRLSSVHSAGQSWDLTKVNSSARSLSYPCQILTLPFFGLYSVM